MPSEMRSSWRNMCGRSRNKAPNCVVFLTILLGQKVPKTLRLNSGFLKNSISTKLKERSICKTTAPKLLSVR